MIDVNVKLMLVSEDGEVLDVTDPMPADEWNLARQVMPGAYALLRELQAVEE